MQSPLKQCNNRAELITKELESQIIVTSSSAMEKQDTTTPSFYANSKGKVSIKFSSK
jgi:hypothetical protein